MTQEEHKMIQEVQTPHGKWWIPFVWTFNLIKDARNEGRINDDYMLKTLMDVSTTFAKQWCINGTQFYRFDRQWRSACPQPSRAGTPPHILTANPCSTTIEQK